MNRRTRLLVCSVILSGLLLAQPLAARTARDYWDPDILVYQMWEIQVLLLRNTESLDEGAAQLSDHQRLAFIDSLEELDCTLMPPMAQADCRAWKEAASALLRDASLDQYERGQQTAELLSAYFVPILVALEISESRARSDLLGAGAFGHPEIMAQMIGGALRLERAVMCYGLGGVKPECPSDVNPTAYFFGMYQAIGILMHSTAADGESPVRLQAALLSLDPLEVVQMTSCARFTEVHGWLLQESHYVLNDDLDEAQTCLMEGFLGLARVVNEEQLSDQEIIDAGWEVFLGWARDYRNIDL